MSLNFPQPMLVIETLFRFQKMPTRPALLFTMLHKQLPMDSLVSEDQAYVMQNAERLSNTYVKLLRWHELYLHYQPAPSKHQEYIDALLALIPKTLNAQNKRLISGVWVDGKTQKYICDEVGLQVSNASRTLKSLRKLEEDALDAVSLLKEIVVVHKEKSQ